MKEFLQDIAKGTSDKFTCRLPCTQVRYEARPSYVHGHFPQAQFNHTPVFFYYDAMVVRTTEEVPVYDVARLVSAVGGSLGLLLGFSVLTTGREGIAMIARKWK